MQIMEEEKEKFQSVYSAFVASKRLEDIADDKNFLPVYASSNASIFPYQIMAARFALRSDYLKGCILCDEASLGKTYEALLVVCQKWFEGKENILIILPNNLTNQWFRKLEKDFPTIPYKFWNNTKTIPEEVGIKITTYDIAIRYYERVKEIDWDIVVFDEADILARNENKSVQILKEAVGKAYKLLLTPTPITKSIMDIYWLIWFIDESVLPDADWFYKRYYRKSENYHELTEWVSQFCFRTLKCQTTDYVNFTKRIPITINYKLLKEEKDLYKLISAYILSDDKSAYPEIDNYNLNLLLFKSLSSSPDAFVNLLNAPIKRSYGHEKAVLEEIQSLAEKIRINSKTEELLKILNSAFNHLKTMKIKRKAIIFAENNLTLDYLYRAFKQANFEVIKYKDNESIEQFRFFDNIEILIANDEAAKGIDLEFCPIIVNYDLPYDSIKLEQRICRCHRQGQKSDVLVINMLSKENFADVRILELINKRTLQFNGIFGMSDDIVGNFDTKIKEILKEIRHKNEIEQSFNDNLKEHKQTNEIITENAENILFTTFTKSISDKFTVSPKYIEEATEKINKDFWEVIKYFFSYQNKYYIVEDEEKTITKINKESDEVIFYYSGKGYKGKEKYGIKKDFKPGYNRITLTSPIAKGIFNQWNWRYGDMANIYVNEEIEPCQIGFYCIGIKSKDGYETSKHILIGQTQTGEIISEEKCKEILKYNIVKIEEHSYTNTDFYNRLSLIEDLDNKIDKNKYIEEYISSKQGSFAYEIEKLKMLSGRKKSELEFNLKDLKAEIERMKKESKNTNTPIWEELGNTKQLKLKQKELMKKEENLFFDKAQIDADTEKEIAELTEKQHFRVVTNCYFKLNYFNFDYLKSQE